MTTIVTHNGHFHADELLAVAALLLKYPEAKIVRSRNPEVIPHADIVVDVGQIYNPEKGRFDHHQIEGAGKHTNGIPYASFGLVWKEFGKELAGGDEEALYVEETLVMPVDALDNGLKLSTPLFEHVQEYSIGDFFESYAFGAESLEDSERQFFVALPIAQDLLRRKIMIAKTKVAGRREVRAIYGSSLNKEIIVLPRRMSWKQVLAPTEAKFVISQRSDGSWEVQGVPKTMTNPFDRKKFMPAAWGGKDNGELSHISGVNDALFCHRDLWLAAAKSQEGAVKLAQIALNS